MYHTILVPDLLKDIECLWNSKSEQYRNKATRKKAIGEIVKELNLSDLTGDDIKLKVKSIDVNGLTHHRRFFLFSTRHCISSIK